MQEEMKNSPDFPPANWRCNAIDHNSDKGCSNPECFKHANPDPRWKLYNEWFDAEWDRIINKGILNAD